MAARTAKQKFELEVPEQGVPLQTLSLHQLQEWFEEEKRLWSELSGFGDSLEYGGRNYRVPNPVSTYTRALTKIIKQLNDEGIESSGWKEFVAQARELKSVLMQGQIGERVRDLMKDNLTTRAHYLVLVHSESILDNSKQTAFLDPLRATIIDSPFQTALRDLTAARAACEAASESRTDSKELRSQVESSLDATQQRLEALEATYYEKLLLEGPSRHWGNVAEGARIAKRVAFISFCVLLGVPALLIGWYWMEVAEYVEHVITLSSGQFSLASIVVFTVPVLAYAWLLKHVSRSYVQNSAMEVDARHRRVMAVTFLGLVKRKTISLEEADRALILNALFRPAPPHSSDDGPPTGLADLLRGRA